MLIIALEQEAYFFDVKVCCVSSLELPHLGDSNEYTQYTIPLSILKKIRKSR